MARVLAIQNTKSEGLGNLGRLLEQDGFDITRVNAKRDPIPDGEFSLAVILGAPESANDDLPYLLAEKELVRRFVRNGTPVLGICLGSQLVAGAFGGRVYAGPKREVGFYRDLRVEGGHGLFSGFASPFAAFHWHGDTFELPEGAVRLASSKYYENQAFRYGSAVGLQFHIEVDEQTINLWLDNAQDTLRRMPGIDPDMIRAEIVEMMPRVESNLAAFYRNFKSEFGL